MLVFLSVIVTLGFGVNAMALNIPSVQMGNTLLDISTNLRLRYECQNNYNIKKYANTKDNYLLERFRFNVELKTQQGLKASIQFQDSHCADSLIVP